MTTTFTATSQVPCRLCGGDTMPPYTDDDGYTYEDFYCEACGELTPTPKLSAADRR